MLTRRNTLTTALAALVAGAGSRASAQTWTAGARAALAPGGPIETALDELHARGGFHGAVLAAIDGRAVLARGWGLADREAGVPNSTAMRYNIASTGKMFTSVAIGQLLERGAIGLEDRVGQHVRDLPPELGDRITIEQLLTHTSGLGAYFAAPGFMERRTEVRTLNDYLAYVIQERIPADYDGAYRYSNSGFALLGAVVERVSGVDYYEYVRTRVFEPAGMTRTGYPMASETSADRAYGYGNGCFARPPSQCTPGPWQRVAPADRGSPAGGGASTAENLAAFVEALKAGRLLRRETLDLMKASHVPMDRAGGPLDAYGYGFGRLTVNGHPTWGHNGGTPGFQSQVDIFEDGPLTLIVMSNHDGGQRAASAALRRAAA